MVEQEFAPLPGVFTRFVCLSNKRQALERELRGVGETDPPTSYPAPTGLLCSVEVTDRLLEAVPGRGYQISRRSEYKHGTYSMSAARYSGWCFLKMARAVRTEVVHSG